MYNRFKIMAVLGLMCFMHSALGQNLSNKGKEFWVGYGHHQFMEPGGGNGQEMVIYLSAEQAANVTVSIDGTPWVRNYAIPANTVIASDLIPKSGTYDARLYSLPCTFVPVGTPCGGEGVFVNKGIHIVSDVPIVAYAHIYGSTSSGATMLMPVETWGHLYVTLNSKQNYNNSPPCFSWAYAIASHDNTVIEVIPSQLTRGGKPAGIPYTVTLQRGQIYQFMAGPESGTIKPEFSGTRIRSIANENAECHPIAVFAGSSRTNGSPVTCGSPSGGDNDNQQCFPSQAWGKRYLTAPTSNSVNAGTRMWNTYKIAIKDAGTNVYRNGTLLTTLIANSYYEFISNEPEYITADKPVMVAQFIHSGGACFGGGGVGDPEMIYLSPIEQGIKRIGFYRNDEENISVNYLTLIIPTAGVASLTIDGSSTFTHTYPHPKLPGYTVVVRRWTAGKAQAKAQSDSAFTAITYGLGGVESYGYNAGTLINNLNAVGSIHNTEDPSGGTSHPFTCDNTPVELSVLLAYQPTMIVWKLSALTGNITPNADVTDNAPVQVGPPVVINGIPYYKYTLAGTYQFSQTGTFNVPITTSHPSIENCKNSEDLFFEVIVNGKPKADFTVTHSGCVSDAVQFNGAATSSNGFDLAEWVWTFPDGTTSNTQNPTFTFPTPGIHNVNLYVVSAEGCVSDTIKEVTIHPRPTTTFGTTPASVCQDGTITFSDTTEYLGSAPVTNWYWDFGTNVVNSPTNANQVQSFPDWGDIEVQHAVSVSPTCVSDTAKKIVRIWAKPFTPFTYPAGCLPNGGEVQFQSNAYAPDGQAITSYSWDFGDPNATPGNPNTSTLANPTHIYSSVGTYTINFSVTTANGCTKDTTVVANFNPPPTFAYPALSPVCGNAPALSVATASVTNGVTGTSLYHGPGTDAAGNFDPAVAGPGTHTIWYVFSSTAGCKDSVSQTITVNPVPSVTYALGGSTCLPVDGNVQFNYTGAVLPGQTYLWNFGDPGATPGNPNTSTAQSPTHNYTTGTYTINLQVSTPDGCVKDTTATTTFSLLPQLTYPPLAAVCVSHVGTVSVATASVTNTVPGTGIYKGPATDPAGNFTPSVAGPGTHTIWYVFTATGNCKDSVSQTILVNPKPNASFTAPTACLDADGIGSFTYNGSMSPGQTYLWNFNDPNANAGNPNTSTLQDPTHIFINTGSYNISVTTTDANGCTDDSVSAVVISVKPGLNYPALAPVCESNNIVSVATATVINGVLGTGVYSGPGTDAAGNFNPAIAGGGVHTIWYKFTSTANCVDSISQTVTVASKPLSSFTIPAAACLGTDGLVQFTYNGTVEPGITYLWNFDDPNATPGNPNTSTLANPTHNYTNTGTYNVLLTVTNANGCTDDSTITATFSVTPALNYPALTTVCESETATINVATATVINGVTGTGVYSGPGTDAAGNFNPLVAGPGNHTITYTFTSTGNCVNTATSNITVNPAPLASFTIPNAACLPTTGLVQFTFNGSTTPGQTYAWDFNDPNATPGNPNTSTVQSPTHNYTNTGTYNVTLLVTGANGCTHDSTITATFSVTPELAYPTLTAVCENNTGTISVATATVLNSVLGTGVYSGPGTDAAGNFNPAVAGPGNHTITYTFTSTGNCVNTATSNITVNPAPLASFTIPAAACLPTTGLVQFTFNGSTTPGQTYSWDFNDPNATPGNPNTSTVQSPSHNYTNTGTYNIVLTVIGANGCSHDSTITATFSVTPALAYPALAAVCESVPGTINVATATVTNGVLGTGVYSGPGTDAAGNFNPSVAGPGNHTITYTFTSTGNCVQTITSAITVNPKPTAAYTVQSDLCLGQDALFTSSSSIPSGSISTWTWSLGTGAPVTNTNGNPFTHTYGAFQAYNTWLVTVSDQGCISDTARNTVNVHANPVAAFTPPASVCMPGGNALFTNNSTVPDNAALTYEWDFGDLSPTSSSFNGNHVYAGIGTYNVTLTATSSFGCVGTVTTPFSSFFDKPVAGFTITPDAVCQGTPMQFTDGSNAPNSSIAIREWNFGDGGVSSELNPTRTYTHPGVYNVLLTVTSTEGCVSDPFPGTATVYLQPIVDAGQNFVVPAGTTVQFQPDVNDPALNFLWTPPIGLSDATALQPTTTVNSDQTYTLTATGDGGCTASDIMFVKVLRPVNVPNAFSPNGDGVNDTWIIRNLVDYPGAMVEVFNRYGQKVFSSKGYSQPWDGTIKGKPLPFATYYYVITLENGFKPLNGSITIIR